jgi:hypothetical protein
MICANWGRVATRPDGVAQEAQMLWALILILLILWLAGFIIIDTSLVHLLLVIALIILIYQLVTGRRAV